MQTKTKRKRLSRGGRWTEEERLQLVRLRDRNKHLAWDQFQKIYFPRRSYMALTKAYSDMKLKRHPRDNTMTNHTSNETMLPPKTNRPNKRPITDERSVNERANKQAKTAERDPSYVPEEDGEGSQFSEGEDIAHDSSLSPVHGRTRSSANSLAKIRAQNVAIRPISQNPRNTTSLQTGASDKAASESPSRARPTRGPERILGSVRDRNPVSTTTAMQSISPPKANPSDPPSKASQPGRATSQIESLDSGTTHDLFSSLVKSIADHRKSYELLPKFPERQGSELITWSLLGMISDALSYPSAQLRNEKQTRELQEFRSEIDTRKKGQKSLEAELSKAKAELSKARGETAKLEQQIKSTQSQGCKECRRLQERNTTLEEKLSLFKRVSRQLLSGSEEKQPPPGSSTSTTAISG
ncbi:hypothetical protein BDV38DRAFT_187785 [Aspergillus pseudotamarii]|uniref:Myb-like domain-containing protein n=1 Tax=Aspergillus pseudotamarii TaxID=132259 RepID=A0A5N6SF02_ASPPS|nr:uncharacterized protein BDV38DRAFT_187785 [Aspergillus pseudotamarii]KAE8133232.1 hypothetical protein BDV38DRAFT_187785 [Aspergillus pseudotamarii]